MKNEEKSFQNDGTYYYSPLIILQYSKNEEFHPFELKVANYFAQNNPPEFHGMNFAVLFPLFPIEINGERNGNYSLSILDVHDDDDEQPVFTSDFYENFKSKDFGFKVAVVFKEYNSGEEEIHHVWDVNEKKHERVTFHHVHERENWT